MKPWPSPLSALLSLLFCTAAACDGQQGQKGPPVDYHHDAVAVLDRYCNTCHTAGGIAPFTLTDYQAAQGHAGAIKAAVTAGTMPPWMAADTGVPLRYSRAMRQQDKDLLLGWIDGGAVEGDPAEGPRTDIPAAETVAAARPDLVLDPEKTYQPNLSLTDDYHCFVFDPKVATDTFLQAALVKPGNAAIVHHVLVFEIPATDAASVQQKNVAGGGYTCFGGPGSTGRPVTLFGWAPGGVPMRTPQGTALRLSAGSLLVMQVHYNLLSYKGQGDRTTIQLELNATPPQRELFVLPVANPAGLKIPAGDAQAQQTITAPVSLISKLAKLPAGDLVIHSAAPHMHLLGTRIVSSLTGNTLVEVPRWDFHWQQAYTFMQPVVAHPTDLVQLECDYDNSAGHQPVVNGQPQQPRDVTWGEGTLDEMCLTYLTVTAP